MPLPHKLHTVQFEAVNSRLTERCCDMLLALSNVSAEVSKGVKKGLFPIQFKISLVAMPQPCLPVQVLQQEKACIRDAGLLA